MRCGGDKGIKLMENIKAVSTIKVVLGTVLLLWVGILTVLTLGVSSERLPLYVKAIGIFTCVFLLAYVINGIFLHKLIRGALIPSILLDLGAITINLLITWPQLLFDIRRSYWNLSFCAFLPLRLSIFISFIYYFSRPKVRARFK